MQLAKISAKLARQAGQLHFAAPVTHVYNPLQYAWELHEAFLALAQPEVPALLLGMNPGPWGMAQTGVPFGEVSVVRDWLGLTGVVNQPALMHPKRPVEGLACSRSEVSGQRLWAWAKDRFSSPKAFFSQFFIGNFCPLAFLEESGRNRTPDKLPASERDPLFALCDQALRDLVTELKPQQVIGIGKFAEAQAKRALADFDLPISTILHPSPASPAANRGWQAQAERKLTELGWTFDQART
jgi:single-strand selective monofunctional uracil DNA glycosylase